jgi:hypothetical protein
VAGSLTDFFSTAVPDTMGETQTFLAELRARWHRSVGPSLTTDLEAGVAATFRSGGDAQVGPTALAGAGYHRDLWFATLIVSQTQLPNPFLGQITVNDQALARLVLPLTRRELVALAGFASYLYASTGEAYTRLYDQRAAGAVLSARFARRPFWASLEYTYLDQHGGVVATAPTAPVQSAGTLHRQVLILSVGGAFAWGPGTPPLFHGGI